MEGEGISTELPVFLKVATTPPLRPALAKKIYPVLCLAISLSPELSVKIFEEEL